MSIQKIIKIITKLIYNLYDYFKTFTLLLTNNKLVKNNLFIPVYFMN